MAEQMPEMSTQGAFETIKSSIEDSSSSNPDPYAWDASTGRPADSAAMMNALRGDSKKMADAQSEPEILKLLGDDDVAGFSALAQRCFQVRFHFGLVGTAPDVRRFMRAQIQYLLVKSLSHAVYVVLDMPDDSLSELRLLKCLRRCKSLHTPSVLFSQQLQKELLKQSELGICFGHVAPGLAPCWHL